MTPALRFLSAAITTASPDEASGSLFIAGVFLNGFPVLFAEGRQASSDAFRRRI